MQQNPEAGFSLTKGYNFRESNKPLEYFYKQKEGFKYDNVFIAFLKSEVSATMPSLVLRKQYLEATGLFKQTKPLLV